MKYILILSLFFSLVSCQPSPIVPQETLHFTPDAPHSFNGNPSSSNTSQDTDDSFETPNHHNEDIDIETKKPIVPTPEQGTDLGNPYQLNTVSGQLAPSENNPCDFSKGTVQAHLQHKNGKLFSDQVDKMGFFKITPKIKGLYELYFTTQEKNCGQLAMGQNHVLPSGSIRILSIQKNLDLGLIHHHFADFFHTRNTSTIKFVLNKKINSSLFDLNYNGYPDSFENIYNDYEKESCLIYSITPYQNSWITVHPTPDGKELKSQVKIYTNQKIDFWDIQKIDVLNSQDFKIGKIKRVKENVLAINILGLKDQDTIDIVVKPGFLHCINGQKNQRHADIQAHTLPIAVPLSEWSHSNGIDLMPFYD